jgi:hypothetical protein
MKLHLSAFIASYSPRTSRSIGLPDCACGIARSSPEVPPWRRADASRSRVPGNKPAAARSACITALERLRLSCAFALKACAGISWAMAPAAEGK